MSVGVQLKLRGESPSLLQQIQAEGYSGRMIKNGIVVELNRLVGADIYALPECTKGKDITLVLSASESGGGRSNTGYAHLVAGMSGKPLKPYLVSRGGHLACGVHAHFTAIEKLLSVVARHGQGSTTVSLVSNSVTFDPRTHTGKLQKEVIWEGRKDELPGMHSRYAAVVHAAHSKAHCYHCRCLHYAIQDN